ncbi:outer dense fiber protein 3-B [Micropterus salmoides]|uniref:outer dense fiber protein 3-B n=1 Tax=Micropterus salmoides TaxID=27706 RepID=UPI0018EB945B|nr:outer dense fiber protein 3-B [Micropterus salmoides]XP_045893501.1 outer dense fiber protein 3-B [Micropterus dolomieu]
MASTEPWVGTWRPHKPRGPIAALYGSPGPKYALPGLTGISKHDPTKYKAPMFSFGTRHDQATADCSPGPKYLVPSNITREGRDGTPAFSLHSRPKEPGLFQAPGPGNYSPERSGKSIFRSAPAYSLSGRSKEGCNNQTPGPASYSLPPVLGHKTVATSAAPTYSLCGRSKIGSFHEDLRKTPGPAAYKVVDPCTYRQKPPQYSMTGRNFSPGETTKKPGPGAYYPERVTFTRAKAPSFSFGLRHSQFISPLIVDVPEL